MQYNISHYYFTLMVPRFSEKNNGEEKDESIYYCRSDLFSNLTTLMMAASFADDEDNLTRVYKYGAFKNWSPGRSQNRRGSL